MRTVPVRAPGSRPLLTAYGAGGFRFGETRIAGSCLIVAESPVAWPVDGLASLRPSDFADVMARAHEIEFVLLGTGARIAAPPAGLREVLLDAGLGLEFMDTGAAARTYNHLTGEGRAFAAALIAV
jgi:uncharacterized protein